MVKPRYSRSGAQGLGQALVTGLEPALVATLGVLALGVVGLAAVAARPGLTLRLLRSTDADVATASGTTDADPPRSLVAVGVEVRLLLGHVASSFRKATKGVATFNDGYR